jgi:hypothetical protein
VSSQTKRRKAEEEKMYKCVSHAEPVEVCGEKENVKSTRHPEPFDKLKTGLSKD